MKGFCLVVVGAIMLIGEPLSAQQAASSQATSSQSTGPVGTPRIIMLRLYVNDLDRGEKFYHQVFGTTVVRKMGDNVRIMNFPGGALPGIIMIKSTEGVKMNGSFLIQVPDVQTTLDLAAANGGTLHNTHFAEAVGGMPAQSSHFTDPDGNVIEVFQIGKAK